jgi:hypothetical protein
MEERRDAVRRLRGAVSGAIAGCVLLAGGVGACELPPGTRVESERLAVSFRTAPAKIAVGVPFTLELAACPKKGSLELDRIRLDAHMPEHRHGMNYQTKVVRLAPGRFHSEGWLFHMPGRWEFVFDHGPERLTHSVRLE